MNREPNKKKITFFDMALDCCAVVYLTIFWIFDFILPIIIMIYLIIHGLKNISYFLIIYGMVFILFWIPYFVARGIIKRKRFYILMGIITSMFFINIDINEIKSVSGAELIKHTGAFQSLVIFIFLDIILFFSLLLRGLYKK